VWAVGVILYELITLRKPFDSDSINGVFEKIKKAPLEPLPQSTDANLKMLVTLLLNKDHNKRPNIFEISKIPCIRKQIIKFVEEYNLKDEVMAIVDIDTDRSS
jgi:serine/threonine protein kinase